MSYSVAVSGPSPRMAMLAALIRKMAATGQQAWTQAHALITGITEVGRGLATGTLAIIGAPTGYTTATRTIRTAVRGTWRLGLHVLHTLGHAVQRAGRHAHGLIAAVSPTAARRFARATHAVVTPVLQVAATLRSSLETAGELVWWLAGTDLVHVATTRAAQLATLVVGVHALTSGALAARIVQALPWTWDAVASATNPVHALAFVAGTAATAMGIALIRLLRSSDQDNPEPTDPAAAMTVPVQVVPDINPRAEEQVLTDLTLIAAKVSIQVQPDGSVTVTGIPDTVPEDLGQAVAEIAIDAATRQLERTLRLRRTPNRDDRRVLTKVARDAIRTEAQRRTTAAA